MWCAHLIYQIVMSRPLCPFTFNILCILMALQTDSNWPNCEDRETGKSIYGIPSLMSMVSRCAFFFLAARFYSLTLNYLRRCDGVILMYDVTNRQTYRGLLRWMVEVQVRHWHWAWASVSVLILFFYFCPLCSDLVFTKLMFGFGW